jgi:peptidylprolyl isomerase
MAVKKGDFVKINYTCKVKETGELVETTLSEVAEKEGLHGKHEGEAHSHEPMFIILGEGWVPKGVEEALEGMEVGQEKTLEVPPEKGFGVRDPSKMRLLPLRKFSREGISPVPGMQVEVDGKPALIRSVGAGRVQVDFNHPLSGKSLVYELKVESTIEETVEKIKAMLHRRAPSLDLEKTRINIHGEEVSIEIPEDSFFMEGIQLIKRNVANDLHKYLPEFKTVVFMERFTRPQAAVEAEQRKASSPKGNEP